MGSLGVDLGPARLTLVLEWILVGGKTTKAKIQPDETRRFCEIVCRRHFEFNIFGPNFVPICWKIQEHVCAFDFDDDCRCARLLCHHTKTYCLWTKGSWTQL